MLHVVLWKWVQPNFRERYTDLHVNIVAQMVRRNIQRRAVRVHCITDEPHGIWEPTIVHELWRDFDDLPNVTGKHLPSCYRRLKLFDRATQEKLGIVVGDRVCSLDLDSIVLLQLDDVLDQIETSKAPYGGWAVPGTYHKTVFNGSFWTFVAGDHMQHVWSTFDPKDSPKQAFTNGFLGSDQGWLSFKFARDPNSFAIRFPDFASYPREIRRSGLLDRRTKVVFFHGSRKPWHPDELKKHPWIVRAWRTSA